MDSPSSSADGVFRSSIQARSPRGATGGRRIGASRRESGDDAAAECNTVHGGTTSYWPFPRPETAVPPAVWACWKAITPPATQWAPRPLLLRGSIEFEARTRTGVSARSLLDQRPGPGAVCRRRRADHRHSRIL